jgi:hypothetical protein
MARSPARRRVALTLEIPQDVIGCPHAKAGEKNRQSQEKHQSEGPGEAKTLTLGLVGFAKISAVEGITLRASTKKMFADFDRRGLSPAERRREIFEKHAKKA